MVLKLLVWLQAWAGTAVLCRWWVRLEETFRVRDMFALSEAVWLALRTFGSRPPM